MHRRKLTTLAVALVAGLSLNLFVATAAQADEPRGTRISRAEIISRAQDWWQRDITYSQTAYANDIEGSKYRTDCSGFISMVWRLPTSSSNNWGETTYTLDEFGTTISKSSLAPGDILLTDGHVKLFEKWENKSAGTFWIFEQANSADDMDHEITSLSSVGAYTAYKYGDGDGAYDDRLESFDEVSGTGLATPNTGSGSCNYHYIGVVALTGYHNVNIGTYACAIHDFQANTIQGWLVVAWWPTDGSDDSTTTVGAKFDGFGLHPQLQVGSVTRREGKCWVGGIINGAATGHYGCLITAAATAGSWSLDGWLNWDENNDGQPWYGPRYTYGSPIV